MGDRIQLQQVIINLLVNSVQAIAQSEQPTRRIDIQTSIDEENSIVFSIFDNGQGVAATDLGHIFESFFSTKDAGIGIGLAICQSIIIAHGGTIRVQIVRTAAHIFTSRFRCQRSPGQPRAMPHDYAIAFAITHAPRTSPKYRSIYPLAPAN